MIMMMQVILILIVRVFFNAEGGRSFLARVLAATLLGRALASIQAIGDQVLLRLRNHHVLLSRRTLLHSTGDWRE